MAAGLLAVLKKMRKIVLVIACLAACYAMLAVPASPEPILRYQPDGSVDTLYLHGDEYYHYFTDIRGHILPETEYADSSLMRVAASHRAPQQQLANGYVPTNGKVRIPVILVNFTDKSFTLADPVAQLNDMFNGNGGSNPRATGSVHTYYAESSNGALDLEYEVHGPYNLSHNMVYYGGNKTNVSYTDHNVRADELVKEAVQLASNAGVDFSRYDADNDGEVDNVSIVVAGHNEAEGGKAETIWPHYNRVRSTEKYNGKSISGYLMISEYAGSGGTTQAGIGTYCHEFGHALGLPDLYDTSDSYRYTVGTWDIMCSGSYNNNGCTPPSYTAFERFVMGWLEPEQVSTAGLRTLKPIETSNEALLIAAKHHNLQAMAPSPAEYFLLENRQAVGWDAGRGALVAAGLLVTHITFNSTTWYYNSFNNSDPLGFAIVSAGMSQAVQSTAADVFPGSTKRTTWQPTLNDGTVLNNLIVSQIRQRSDGNIAMYIGEVGDDVMHFAPEELEVITTFLSTPYAYDTATAMLHFPATQCDSIRFYIDSNKFRFSVDGGTTWCSKGDEVWLRIAKNKADSLPVKVVYLATRTSCDYTYASLAVEAKDESMGTQLMLSGRSPRPVRITTPVIDSVSAITTHSFRISWLPQEDADGYYYTLYTQKEGESVETEEFEDFSKLDGIIAAGWEANFVRTQATISNQGAAVLITQSGQYMQSPKYLQAPVSLSMWLSNNYTPVTSDGKVGGELKITGSADGKTWEYVTTIVLQRTTKNTIRTVELDASKGLRQFRIQYTHIGGNGGAVLDTWSAHFPVDITYIYPLKDSYLSGDVSELVFRNMEANTTYYYAMQTFDGKNCEPAYSELSVPVAVTTHSSGDEGQLRIARSKEGVYTIILPEEADGTRTLAVYDEAGHCVMRTVPLYGQTTVQLPQLNVGQVYIVKYFAGKMKRKDLRAKLLYY